MTVGHPVCERNDRRRSGHRDVAAETPRPGLLRMARGVARGAVRAWVRRESIATTTRHLDF